MVKNYNEAAVKKHEETSLTKKEPCEKKFEIFDVKRTIIRKSKKMNRKLPMYTEKWNSNEEN
jgi:hypothetical protein